MRWKSDNSLVATYEYDPLGRRIGKWTTSTSRSFYWLGPQLAMEYDGSGMFSRRHYGGKFGHVTGVAQRDLADLDNDGNTVEHLLLTPVYDGAFDCVRVLGPTGAVVESYVHTYERQVTIANASGQTISASVIGWQQGYGGLHLDAETGLHYGLHRYYCSATGRFATEDPLGRWLDAPNAGNGYLWVGNTYRNARDSLGLSNDEVRRAVKTLAAAARKASAAHADDSKTWSTAATHPDGRLHTFATPELLNALAAGDTLLDIAMIDELPGAEAQMIPPQARLDTKNWLLNVWHLNWQWKNDAERLMLILHEVAHRALVQCGSTLMHTHHGPREGKWYKYYQEQTLRVLRLLDEHTQGGLGIPAEGWAWLEYKYTRPPNK